MDLNQLLTSFSLAISDGIRDFKRRYPDLVFDYSEIDKLDPAGLFTEFSMAYADYAGNKKLYVLIDEYDNFANELLSQDIELFLSITGKNGFLKKFYASIKNQIKRSIAKTFITGVSSVIL